MNVIFTLTRIALLARSIQYDIYDQGKETTFFKYQDYLFLLGLFQTKPINFETKFSQTTEKLHVSSLERCV